jgi:two-component system LytT family sensor kinase
MSPVVPASPGLIVDLLGFLTGTVLYVMLVTMVWRERMREGMPFLSRRGRLPLLTGVCGVVWNLGALASFVTRAAGAEPLAPAILAATFSALGFLPAVVVHSLFEGRETVAGRRIIGLAIATAYGLSATAAVLHIVSAARGLPVPSGPALWLLTGGFTALIAVLLFVTPQQPVGRRGIWVVALSVFAVSALHFGRHVGNEAWWVELIGHHASLPLALAILHQGYRFALADLFLKNAIALLSFMGISLAVFSGAMAPLLRWQDASGQWDPRAISLFVALWMATALTFPVLRRWSAWFVDRAVLRRPDYDAALGLLAERLETAESEGAVVDDAAAAVQSALGITEARVIADPLPDGNRQVVVSGSALRASVPDSTTALLLRLQTVEAPHPAIALGPTAAGRRLLFDDVRLLEAIARLAARRIDSLRVAHERLDRNLREQEMQRLATEAELRALRAQLNPHFLFNALTTIGYLIQHSPARALETLLRLTNVLRGVLRRSTAEFSTLGDEIDLIASYLEIEQARFEERLQVAITVSPDLRAVPVPTLLLQPLVENAVRHGIAGRRSGGAIRVAADLDDGMLRVVVGDTGIGFNASAARQGTGVGLRSVGERLRAHYGARAALRIQSAVGAGTTIEIEIPVSESGDGPAADGRARPRGASMVQPR